jgi:Short C-terminal domain
MKDPVDVDAQVVSTTAAPDGATHGTAVMNLVVQPPGMEAQSIECTSVPAPVAKWPTPGQTLPVTVDRADPSRCKVRWDDVPEWDDMAKQQAAQLAARMNQGGAGGDHVVMGGNADVNDVVAALQQAMPGAEINVQGMEMQGLDATAGPPGSPGDDQRVAQLERLARLRESGALTEQEFEREKARILAQ